MTRFASRNGFALPATLLALVIIGALVTGGVYASAQHDRASANSEYGHYAFLAAERGLDSLTGTWIRVDFEKKVAVGGVTTLGPTTVMVDDVQAQYTVYVKRLNSRLFLVESEGEVLAAGPYTGSKRRLAQVMRINFTSLPTDRAVTTYGPMRTRGKSGIVGRDSIPENWTECNNNGLQKAVVAPSDDPKYIDIKGQIGLVGNPPVGVDLNLDSARFVRYGDMHLDDLKSYADKLITTNNPGGPGPVLTAGGVCDRSQLMNWGDPDDTSSDCHTYWPIIYAPGDLTLSGGTGQGILIVDGDLHLSGGVEFHGIVFVYKALTFTGVGNHVIGSMNVLGVAGDTTDIDATGAGNSVLQLSSCAIERAHMYNDRFGRPIPLAQRKFIDLSGLGIE